MFYLVRFPKSGRRFSDQKRDKNKIFLFAVEFVALQALFVENGHHFGLGVRAFGNAVLGPVGLGDDFFLVTRFFFAGLAEIDDLAHGS